MQQGRRLLAVRSEPGYTRLTTPQPLALAWAEWRAHCLLIYNLAIYKAPLLFKAPRALSSVTGALNSHTCHLGKLDSACAIYIATPPTSNTKMTLGYLGSTIQGRQLWHNISGPRPDIKQQYGYLTLCWALIRLASLY